MYLIYVYISKSDFLFSLGTCGRLHHSDAAQHPQQIHARDVGEAAEPGAKTQVNIRKNHGDGLKSTLW